MAAFKDSGHHWWQQCSACEMAWFIGDAPEDEEAEEECKRCTEDSPPAPAALSALPEDVARDVATVRGVFAGMEGEYAETMGALSRLATAAARVSGLVEENLDLRESREMAEKAEARIETLRADLQRAESERDAARQEVERLKTEAQALRLGKESLRHDRDALTARVAELESMQKTLVDAGNATGDEADDEAERADRAEARATAAEAKVRILELRCCTAARSVACSCAGHWVCDTHGDNHEPGPKPQTTPAPGLRDAVAPLVERLRGVANGPRSVYPSDLEFDWNIRLPSKTWLGILAAYDGTAPCETTGPAMIERAEVEEALDAEYLPPDSEQRRLVNVTLDGIKVVLGLTLPTAPGGGETCPTMPDGVPCEPMESEPERCVYGEHPMPTPRARIAPTPKTNDPVMEDE